MTTFYLIRHAQRETPDDMLSARQPGVQLSERGGAQAAQLAQRLAREGIQRIFSSPMERAQATAAPVAKACGLQVEVSDALNEVDFGEWTGKSVAELAALPRWRAFNRLRSATSLPGGELYSAVQARMVGEIVRLRDAYPDGRIALISHGDPLRVAVAYFAGMPLDCFDRIEISVASITVLALGPEHACVLRMNETVAEA